MNNSSAVCLACNGTNTVCMDKLTPTAFYHVVEGRAEDEVWYCFDCSGSFRPKPISADHTAQQYVEAYRNLDAVQGFGRIAGYLRYNAREREWIRRAIGDGWKGRNPADMHILDVGSKSGGFGLLFAIEGYHVDMVEPTKTFAEFTATHLRVPTIQGFYQPSCYPAERFDLILAAGVIHRVDPPSLFFEAAAKQLKKGGYLFARQAHPLNLDDSYLQDLHRIYFTPYSLAKMAQRYGFQAIAFEDYGLNRNSPYEWKTAYCMMFKFAPGTQPEIPDFLPRPSLEDVRDSLCATVLGISVNTHLAHKRQLARCGWRLRQIFGYRLAYNLVFRWVRFIQRISSFIARRLR